MAEPLLSVQQLAAQLASATPPYVLDVREDTEWEQSRIDNPYIHHLPLSRLENGLEALPHDQPIAVLCRSGGRSMKVTALLNALGYQASNVTGGMLAWVATIDPTLPNP